MIEIKIYTLPVNEDGVDERTQVAQSLSAIGFFRPEDLTAAPAPAPLAPVDPVEEAPAEDKPKTRGRPKKEAAKAEAPADPAPAEAPADPAPAEAAQDAADEAAEVAEAKPEETTAEAQVYDVNDMRGFGKAYADAYGMDATLSDIPGIIGFDAFSQVPADKVDAVARLVKAAIEQNPNNRTKV